MQEKNQKEAPEVTDVHAHILPGIDDGARNLEESVVLLRMAAGQGIRSVIATPHYSRRGPGRDLVCLTECVRQEVVKTYPDFKLYTGQELWYHEGLVERLREGTAYTLADSHYVLVEFVPAVSYRELFQGLRTLAQAGYIPVLAHVERYRCLRQEENHLEELREGGCILQMNYTSLTGGILDPGTRWCRKQILAGRVQLLGTDMHRTDFRPPDITGAMRWLERHVDKEWLTILTGRNPIHVINDERLE